MEGSFAGEWLGETDCAPDSLLLSEAEDPTRVTELKLLGEQGALNTVASGQRIHMCFKKFHLTTVDLPVKVSLLLEAATFGIDKWQPSSWESFVCSTLIDTAF